MADIKMYTKLSLCSSNRVTTLKKCVLYLKTLHHVFCPTTTITWSHYHRRTNYDHFKNVRFLSRTLFWDRFDWNLHYLSYTYGIFKFVYFIFVIFKYMPIYEFSYLGICVCARARVYSRHEAIPKTLYGILCTFLIFFSS